MWSHRCASAYQRQDKVTVTTTPSAPLSRPFPLPLPLQLATVAATSNSTVMYCPSYRDRHRHIHCHYTAVEASLHQSAVHVSRVQSMSPECSLWRQSAIHAFAAIQIVIGIRHTAWVCVSPWPRLGGPTSSHSQTLQRPSHQHRLRTTAAPDTRASPDWMGERAHTMLRGWA
jgi:hypothetical protein